MRLNKTMTAKIVIAVASIFMFGKVYAADLSDAQVAEIMKSANEAEIKAAKIAKSNSDNTEVKNFADKMINEHGQNEKDEKNIATKQDIKFKTSQDCKDMKKDASHKISQLKDKKGAEFDRAYIASQIDMHQNLLNDLNNKFIPDAKNAEFRAYLEKTKDHVQEHLAEAQQLQTSLAK